VKRVGPGGQYYHYRCIRGMAINYRCEGASIPTHILDPLVWEHVESILTRPDIIAAEIDRLRTDDPTQADVAAIDRILADIRRRQADLINHLALFSEPEAAAPIAAQIEALREQEKSVRAEREENLARQCAWETAQQHLSDLEIWCRTVAERLTTITVAEKRLALEALGVQVRVWRAGCTPRHQITMSIPIDIVDECSARSTNHRTDPLSGCRRGQD
jgi:site-specific DNA recombinase